MKIPKLKRWDKIEIEWIDSISPSSRWKPIDGMDWDYEEKFMIHRTCGYFLQKSKTSICICQSYQKEIYSDGDRMMEGAIMIPICAVIFVRKLPKTQL